MAGEALAAVEARISELTAYGDTALAAAEGAVDAVAATDFPLERWSTGWQRSLQTYYPSVGSAPETLEIPTAPSALTLGDVAKPTKPSLSLPSAPTLVVIDIPDSPSIDFPTLDIEKPDYDISDPTSFEFSVDNILINDDPLIVAVKERLTDNIETGGTGLTEAVEDAIWARDLERTEQQIEDSTDKVTSMWAKKGFSLPDGLLAHSLSEVQTEHYNRMIDRTREIAISQATLEQTNMFKSMEIGVGLVTSLVDMLIRYEGVTLQAQESTAKFANEYIGMQIQTYGIKVEGYKAATLVYEAKTRANLARAEVFKTQVDGELAKSQVNEQNVKVYSEQYNAIAVQVQAYKAEIDAMVAELQVEKEKVENNKLQFDVWAKNVDALIAKYNGQVDLYKAESSVGVATAELLSREAETQMRGNLLATELELKGFEVNNNSIQNKAALLLEAQKAVMVATSNMAAGAMSAASASSSLGYSESISLSEPT